MVHVTKIVIWCMSMVHDPWKIRDNFRVWTWVGLVNVLKLWRYTYIVSRRRIYHLMLLAVWREGVVSPK